jgi:hypothetical protein
MRILVDPFSGSWVLWFFFVVALLLVGMGGGVLVGLAAA